ncbi:MULTISPECIES: cyclic nucleotide-binding domain-containing protein [Marinomonas]|uniref:Cyclic nucleotide-binding domain-containing protein n=1 Tax=Marinomonas rhodophyticola TaxID=2992803 RepID=A0ABT3KKB7_9GAMM|nr:cyclic nucleotide-binding domain-containing protein [Marinomonas sp. KJ51-3]MCW4630859.1 cyclic nucleotide-binding domain-containing protein [Marinomonas sp. KJ51-3]
MAAIDIPEVHKFIESIPPFSSLTLLERKHLLTGVTMLYVRQGQTLTLKGDAATVHLIRRGACEIRTPKGGLVDQIADGECFGVSSVMAQNPDGLQVVAMEDSLVYRFDKAHFMETLEKSDAFGLFLSTRGITGYANFPAVNVTNWRRPHYSYLPQLPTL